jgi:hypothetical protein
MSTKVQIVIDKVRRQIADDVKPFFWGDPELLDYIDEGQMEFCRQGYPIRDSRTPDICVLPYKANDFEVVYHESIRRILSVVRQDANGGLHGVTLKTQENALSLFSVRPSDYGVSIDNTRQLNRPSDRFDLFMDYDEGYLRLSSPAETAGTLLFQVERLPKNVLDDCDQNIEVRREYIPALVAWACYRAWNKQDGETFDEKAALLNLDLFEDHANRARIEYKQRHATPGTVRYAFP